MSYWEILFWVMFLLFCLQTNNWRVTHKANRSLLESNQRILELARRVIAHEDQAHEDQP